jgi:hypothetical protein
MPTEHDEQTALFHWAALHETRIPELSLLFAIPNGGHRNKVTAAKMKAEGVKPGVPDTCLPLARKGYNALYLELKRQKGGRVSPEQWQWITALRAQGNYVEVCKGWQAAVSEILSYLGFEGE